MKITIDKNITYGEEAFSQVGDVQTVDGRHLTNGMLFGTDALIVRSVTDVNEMLLKNTPVKFVATATIGTDHLDKEFLQSAGIKYISSPGCNSTAVTEYILALLSNIANKHENTLVGKKLGIIGVGNIGRKVAECARILGIETILNDPPRERIENNNIFSSLEETLEADILTFHTPMNRGGKDNTFHLLDESKIFRLALGKIIINASRGAVIDNLALLNAKKEGQNIDFFLDVWENEPGINQELLKYTQIGTPHIAGYSLEGKINGTKICYDAFCEFTGKRPEWKPVLPPVENNIIDVTGLTLYPALKKIFDVVYNIDEDDKNLRAYGSNIASHFDTLRKNYRVRRELKNYDIFSNDDKLVNLINYLKTI